jgi:uncharacterized protein YjiS (DUF1127 family)
MSQSYSVQRPDLVEPTVATARNIAIGWAHTIEIWLIRYQGRQDLSLLGDHLLKDIGISPEDAFRESGKPFWRA